MDGYVFNTDSNLIEERDKRNKERQNKEYDKKFNFDGKNYLNTKLGPNEAQREIIIRILPVSSKNGDIFLPLLTHQGLRVNSKLSKSGYKNYICLNDSHIKEHDERGCPICRLSKELFDKVNSLPKDNDEQISEGDKSMKKTLLKTAYSYRPKISYIVRVIERGKEDEGVKFWKFNERSDGMGVYDKLMNLYRQRKAEGEMAGIQNYSIFDLVNGKDIKITLSHIPNTTKTAMDIIDCGFNTPLSRDINQANAWICDEKTWEDVYAVKDYDYLDIVANGNIPVYDENQKKWVSMEPNQSSDDMTYDSTTLDDAMPTNMPYGQQNMLNPNEFNA